MKRLSNEVVVLISNVEVKTIGSCQNSDEKLMFFGVANSFA